MNDCMKHVALPVISSVACILIFFIDSELKVSLIHNLYYDSITLPYQIISFTCVGSLLFYILYFFKHLPPISSIFLKHPVFKRLSLIVIVSIIVSGLSFSSIVFHSMQLLFVGTLLFSCLILAAICLHVRFPLFLVSFLNEIREKERRKTHLRNINVSKALQKLHYFMEEEHAYETDLSLTSVAKSIGLTTHQLSEIINHELGRSFSTYVMEFRIKEAIKRLRENKHKTVISIAQDVGFRSHSAFYVAFRRITKKKPSDFR